MNDGLSFKPLANLMLEVCELMIQVKLPDENESPRVRYIICSIGEYRWGIKTDCAQIERLLHCSRIPEYDHLISDEKVFSSTRIEGTDLLKYIRRCIVGFERSKDVK
jgi:hypothetical protein